MSIFRRIKYWWNDLDGNDQIQVVVLTIFVSAVGVVVVGYILLGLGYR